MESNVVSEGVLGSHDEVREKEGLIELEEQGAENVACREGVVHVLMVSVLELSPIPLLVSLNVPLNCNFLLLLAGCCCCCSSLRIPRMI